MVSHDSASVPMFDRGLLSKSNDVHVTCPEFKVKAHHVKLIASWLSDLLNAEMTDAHLVTAFHAPMSTGAFALASFFYNMDTMPRLLSAGEADEMAGNVELFLACHLVLTDAARQEELALFSCRPKFHMLAHLVRDVRLERMNPKFAWCYGDEDYMHHVAMLARMTHRRTTSLRILERLRQGFVQQLLAC